MPYHQVFKMGTLTVTTTADKGSGSLRDAIAKAKSGDIIQFNKALTGRTITLTSGQLALTKNLTIDGSAAAGLTISGNNASRVLMLDKKCQATLKNLTIANGRTTGAGGGIDTRQESTLVLDNVKVNNNVSELGGGLRVGHRAKATILNSSFTGNDGTLTNKYFGFSAGAISHSESRGQIVVKGSCFENNLGSRGGAIYSFSSVTFRIEDSIFRNNISNGSGGAIFTDGVSSRGYNSGLADDGKIIIRGSRFENNQAKKEGGALFLWGYTRNQGYKQDQAIIEDTVIVGNTVKADASGYSKGGGLWAKMGLNIRNVTFANNTATQQGGGLWVETQLPTSIFNSTFSGNQALGDAGGAMFLKNGSAPVNITSSTIAYNKAGRANGGLWFAGQHNVMLKNSIVAFNTASVDRRQDQVGYQPKDGGGNVEFSTSPKAMRVFTRGLFANPLLGRLTSVNGALIHPLAPGSPAGNAGAIAPVRKTAVLSARHSNLVATDALIATDMAKEEVSTVQQQEPMRLVPEGSRLDIQDLFHQYLYEQHFDERPFGGGERDQRWEKLGGSGLGSFNGDRHLYPGLMASRNSSLEAEKQMLMCNDALAGSEIGSFI
jgi:predicted outer membrane repeat protein